MSAFVAAILSFFIFFPSSLRSSNSVPNFNLGSKREEERNLYFCIGKMVKFRSQCWCPTAAPQKQLKNRPQNGRISNFCHFRQIRTFELTMRTREKLPSTFRCIEKITSAVNIPGNSLVSCGFQEHHRIYIRQNRLFFLSSGRVLKTKGH